MGRAKVHDHATAAALLTAAERLVEAEGLEAITVRRLADEIDTTTRAVYSTFGSKDGVLAALGIRAFEVLGGLVAGLAVTDDPTTDLVRAGDSAFRTFVRRHPGLFHVGFAVTSPGVWTQVSRTNRAAWSELVLRVRRLGDDALGHQAPEQLALQFNALCEGLAINELRGNLGSPRVAKAVWTKALQALLAGWSSAGKPLKRP